MKLADYVINFLADRGVKDVFLVYGAANGDLVDGFTRNDKIRYVCVMHEQAGGFAAEGYARVTKNFGVAMSTSGPGGHNMIASMGNCYYESVPVLFITGQASTKFMKKTNKIRQNAFQETEIVEIAQPVVKYSKMITDPLTIRYELEKSVHLMLEGRPGPVLLDIPLDVQKQEIDENALAAFVPTLDTVADSSEIKSFIQKFLVDLKKSIRPAIIVGGGIKLSKSEQQLLTLLRKLKIPVFPTWNAFDTIATDFPYYGGRIGTFGGAGRNFGIQNCDLLLCLATRLSGRITGGNPPTFARSAKKYLVDIDGEIMKEGRHDVKFDEKLCCNIRYFLDEFNILASPDDFSEYYAWNLQVKEWKEKYKAVLPEYYKEQGFVNPYVFIDLLSEKLKKDDILVADCGGNVVITSQTLKTKTGQLYFSNNSNSPMGFSMAATMGARIAADPNQNVVGIIGDGGMNMNIQELQTLKNYNIGIKMIILNNNIYGITKAFQKINFHGRFEACGPKGYNPPDFKKIADAYGIDYINIENNDVNQINDALDKFFSYPSDVPVILNVNCYEYHRYIPRIVGWNTPIEDMYPYLPREEFRQNMIIQPDASWENPCMPSVET
jgi:acetolactate synthase-1/2/3 large subunit